jgi:hypothetical protein
MPDQKTVADNQINFSNVTEQARYIEGFHEIFGKLFRQGLTRYCPATRQKYF